MAPRVMALRALGVALLFTSIALFPWWVPALLAAALVARFRAYEVLLGGVVMDVLYGVSGSGWFDLPLKFTLGSVVLFGIAAALKRRLIMYA